MASDFGTRAWGRRRDGRLTRAEQWGQTLRAIRPLIVRALTGRARDPDLTLDLAPPDSALARRAEELMTEVSPPWLAQHCHRTYAFGRVIAARERLRFDDELLYCASMLHDLGVTERFLAPEGRCFALHGADVAERTLVEGEMPADRAAIVAEAIALHLNVVVAIGHGPEAYLLRGATSMDVTGQNVRALGTKLKQEILLRHPRLDLVEGICAVLRVQAKRSPTTRAGFLVRRLRLLTLVKAAPF